VLFAEGTFRRIKGYRIKGYRNVPLLVAAPEPEHQGEVGPAGRIPETGESRQEQRGLQGVVAALGAGLALDGGAGSAGDRGEAG
jgi:hypothetical protein